jgi:hypothetical protein
LKNHLLIIIVLLFTPVSIAQRIDADIRNFFSDLIADTSNLQKYVYPDDLERSNRLGIQYEGVLNKFLISFDINKNIKEEIGKGNLNYELLQETEDEFTIINFSVPKADYNRKFHFKYNRLISFSSFYARNWVKQSSAYFNFFISELGLFNDYSVKKLDEYVDAVLNLLNVGRERKEILKANKINYILCKDEDEIEKLTGFRTRGLYILAYDEIITIYNCHFHELAHLLMNFKLMRLPLYTLSFFQEGFAVAVGGRGGLNRNVLFDIAYFLEKSGFIPFNSIITQSEFKSEDASLTYPATGLYNYFLISHLGIEPYCDLYLTYSGTEDYISSLSTGSILLPPIDDYNNFLSNYTKKAGIKIESDESTDNENYYRFRVSANLLLSEAFPLRNYKSKKFAENFPGIEYRGQKYLITANKREVNIYNLYTNNLIASYSAEFTIDNKEVPAEEGYFIFYVKKDIFEEDLKDLFLSEI